MTRTRAQAWRTRICLLGGLILCALIFDGFVEQELWPTASQHLALHQMESAESAQSLRVASAVHSALPAALVAMVVIGAIALLGPLLVPERTDETPPQSGSSTRALGLTGLILTVTIASGCRPYDVPEFEEIDPSETGFLIPMEGAVETQVSLESESNLEQRRVAAKRVQIPHRWVQTGRMQWTGHWIDTVRLIKVDRSPVTCEWTANTTSTKQANRAIWIESKDSVDFSVSFSCTGFIEEEDTARFLYLHRDRSLAAMMDSEVRARIQSIAAGTAAKYDLDELRSRKQEMIDDVRSDIIPFFKQRGITINTVGMFGGFTYQNPKIQEAIDETFVAQQKQALNEALLAAQNNENKRLQLEAEGLANRAQAVAEDEADPHSKQAETTRKTPVDPLLAQLLQLEVERDRIEKMEW